MKHLAFIINPRAGTDRVKELRQIIAAHLDAKKFEAEIIFTQHAGHGTELARKAALDGAFAVAAVGGDGSVNDVATGLLGSAAHLAIVPKGSGNGMARNLRIPLETVAAIRLLNTANPLTVDTGAANGSLFLSNCGAGFDADVAQAFAQSKGRGFVGYASLVARRLWRYRPQQYGLTIDGKAHTETAFLIAVANGRQFGYNFVIAPNASVTDGLLDVVVIRPFPKALGAVLAIRAMRGNILKSPYVRHFSGKSIGIQCNAMSAFQTDGDAHPCTGALDIRVQPQSLRVLVAG